MPDSNLGIYIKSSATIQHSILKSNFIIFFCLSSVLFFYPMFIPANLLYYFYYIHVIIASFLVIINYKRHDFNKFTTPIILILISIIVSIFSAIYFWSQSIAYSIISVLFDLSYVLFLLLVIWKVDVKDVEKVIVILGILYIVVFVLSYFSYPKLIFNNPSIGTERGLQRIKTYGIGFLFLLSFYSLSQYYIKHRFVWLILFFATFICILLSLTRTLIAASFLLSTLYVLRKSTYQYKIIAVVMIVLCFFIITQMDFFKFMIEDTKLQIESGNENIRRISANFYLQNFSPNFLAKVIGNGEPYMDSNYSQYVHFLNLGLGLYQSDIGYIGLWSKFGILAILGYIMLIYRTLRISVSEEYSYCKYFLYFIFIISIIIAAPFSTNYIPAIVLAMYILASKDLSIDRNRQII